MNLSQIAVALTALGVATKRFLSSTLSGFGSDSVGFVDDLPPAVPYLKTMSDLANGVPVGLRRFGCKPSPSTTGMIAADSAMQTACNAVRDYKKGTLIAEGGYYALETGFKVREGVGFRGQAGNSILYAVNPNLQLLQPDDTGTNTGLIEISDINIWGYQDRTSVAGTKALASLSGAARIRALRVEIGYSQQFGLAMTADEVIAEQCYVHHTLRDGINMAGARLRKAIFNRGLYTADDFLGLHLNAFNDTSGNPQNGMVVCIGNYFEKCLGIKILGLRNGEISENVGRFCLGYGLQIGFDSVFNQGGDEFDCLLLGNTFTDIVDLAKVGGGVVRSGLMLEFPSAFAGNSPYNINAAPGARDPVAGGVVPINPYMLNVGPNRPKGASQGIRVIGNTVRQTLSGLTKFSDSGYGSLWFTSGAVDPTMTGTIASASDNAAYGISLKGSVLGLGATANQWHGLTSAWYFKPTVDRIQNVTISDETVTRVRQAAYIIDPTGLTSTNVGIKIRGGLYDLDPYFESPDRSTLKDGTWGTTEPSNYVIINCSSVQGLEFTGATLKNYRRIANRGSSAQIISHSHTLVGDPSANKGIASFEQVGWTRGNHVLWTDSDPSSATYGTVRNVQGASGNTSDFAGSALPTSGSWVAGQRFYNTSLTVDANAMRVDYWLRQTTGTGNTVYAGSGSIASFDWTPMYASAKTPAT